MVVIVRFTSLVGDTLVDGGTFVVAAAASVDQHHQQWNLVACLTASPRAQCAACPFSLAVRQCAFHLKFFLCASHEVHIKRQFSFEFSACIGLTFHPATLSSAGPLLQRQQVRHVQYLLQNPLEEDV